MKKYVLLACLLLPPTLANAQGQFGIEVSPSIGFSRTHTSPNNKGFGSAGASLEFKLGTLFDYAFRDNYFISTGLLLSFQQISIKNPQKTPKSPNVEETHALSYLQWPIGLKLYTSEITLDTRLYVKFAGILQVRINERNTHLHKDESHTFIQKFRRWGGAGLLGIGVEYDISLSTSIFAGLSYQLGLTSAIDQCRDTPPAPQIAGYSDLISMDLGLRF